ncbi:MAG: biopolymer transporter ExbD [Pseudomonadota bacterium]
MNFGPLHEEEVMSEINMTPLVDVMLVLLIIFIVTIPVINYAVKLDLPRAANQPNDIKPPHINIAIDAAGAVSWDGVALDETALKARIAETALRQPQPEMHFWADRKTPYENVVRIMVAAQAGGLTKIGFITEPKH